MYYKTGLEAFTRSSEEEESVPQAKITEPFKYRPSHVAISANGDALLVDGGIAEERPVREYSRSGESWTEGEAPPVGGAHCTTVALSADGQTALLDCVERGSNRYVATLRPLGVQLGAGGSAPHRIRRAGRIRIRG